MLEEADPNAGDPERMIPLTNWWAAPARAAPSRPSTAPAPRSTPQSRGPADPALLDAAAEVTLSEADDDAPNDAPCPPPATTTIATISATPAATAPVASQKRAYRRRRGRSVATAANRRSTF